MKPPPSTRPTKSQRRKVGQMNDKQRKAFFARLAQEMGAKRGEYIMFHATKPPAQSRQFPKRSRAKSIMKHGLRPSGKSTYGRYGKGTIPTAAFLAPLHSVESMSEWATGDVFAVRASGAKMRKQTREHLRKLQHSGSATFLVYKNDKAQKVPFRTAMARRPFREFVSYDTIPPSHIKRLTKRQKESLMSLAAETRRASVKRKTSVGARYLAENKAGGGD